MKNEPSNPFLLVGYHSPAYFCDREQETEKLLEAIGNQRNITLYSIRRMGKTALIKHAFYHLAHDHQITPLYIDLMPTNNFDDLTKRLTEAIIHHFGKKHQGLSAKLQQLISTIGAAVSFDPMTGMPVVNLHINEPGEIKRSLESLLTFLDGQKQQIVLAFDEFQQVVQYPESGTEALLRSVIQEFNGVRFIFSGSHQGIMTSMFTDQGRPFYKSTQMMPLGPIEHATYKAFIRHHFAQAGKTIPDAVIDAILQWCKQQTYYVQLICNRLFARYKEVTEAHLKLVWQEVMDEEQAIFHNYKNLLTYKQWQVLGAIAKAEPVKHPNATEFLYRYQLGAASSISSALNALIDKQLITRDETGYAVQDALLARWLQQH